MNIHKYLYKVVKIFLLMSEPTNKIPDSRRYFQLIPTVLVEYNYHNLSTINNQIGDAEHMADLGSNGSNVISNGYTGTRVFQMNPANDNFVLPINKSESKFINSKTVNFGYSSDFKLEYHYEDVGNNDRNDDILKDTFTLHFTSRNFFGDYDGFIITVGAYDKVKNKVNILSQYIKRTDDPDINKNPFILNQKLYTTFKKFEIPNISALVNSDDLKNAAPGEDFLKNKLFPKYPMLDNSPLVMTIYGVKATYVNNNNEECYNVEKLNSIYIPIVDKSNNISMNIDEAKDGDYFEVYPIIDNKGVSFSDYIDKIADGHPENYIVFYELILREYFTIGTTLHQDVTHKEQFIINAAKDDQDTYKINEDELEKHIYYRPVVIHSSTIVAFSIEVKVNIINTLDNTTTIKNAGLIYGRNVSDNSNLKHIAGEPKKYGKNMSKIYLGEIPAQVNVYNKKPDLDRDGVKLTNASSNVKIENHQHSVIGFIECANVGVSIEQVPTELVQR